MPENLTPEQDLIKDIKLTESVKLDESVDLDIIEKTVNEQLEWLWDKFIKWSTWYTNNLQILEQTITPDNLNWIKSIFENRLKENPQIIKELIVLSNIEAKQEEEIENTIISTWVELNTEKDIVWLLQEIWIKNNEELTDYKTPNELKSTFDKIDAEKENDIQELPKITELLKEWKFSEAIKQLFNIISSLFWKWWEIWLKNYEYLGEYISSLWLDQKNLNELWNMLIDMDKKIESTSDINKKMKFTYILSAIKNKSHEKRLWKKMNSYDLLLTELQTSWWQSSGISAWQVLLINKENNKYNKFLAKMWDLSLKKLTEWMWYDTPFLHSVIVSKIEWNDIYIRHSTMNKQDWKMWIEEIPLSKLLWWYKNADILVMDMPDENKQKMLDYSQKHLNKWTWYSTESAVKSFLWWNKKKEWLNCVELISEWLWDEKIKWTAIPNDLLQSNILTPSYITTI